MIILTPKRVIAIFIFAELFMSGCARDLPDAPRYVSPPPPPPAPVAEPFVEYRPQDRIGRPMEYEHTPDREYTVYAGRGGLTPIVLLPGTRTEGVSLADPEGWRIDDRQSYGSGRSSTPVIVVSPDAKAHTTTAVITTAASDGLYLLRLVPHRTGHKLVRFRKQAETDPATVALMAREPDLSHAGPPYVLRGDDGAWRPMAVQDDGRRTYVRLRPGAGAYGVPAVVAVGTDGKPRPVNSRRLGNVLVVDGVHPALRLSLGDESLEARRSGA